MCAFTGTHLRIDDVLPSIDIAGLGFELAYTLLLASQWKVIVKHLRATSLLSLTIST